MRELLRGTLPPRFRRNIKALLGPALPGNSYRFGDFFRIKILERILRASSLPHLKPQETNVLALCCYMADRRNLIEEIVGAVKEAEATNIEFVVSNNTSAPPCEPVKSFLRYSMPGERKYPAVKKMLDENFNPNKHEYVMVLDDDVLLPDKFFDTYLLVVKSLGIILSQPAMTEDSFGVAPCQKPIKNALAHLTAFVEIGPATCFERRLIPFVPWLDGTPMSWGLDFVWSRVCLQNKWPMGVVDLTPIQHKIRGAWTYSRAKELTLMEEYLRTVRHVPLVAKQVVGEVFHC